MTRTVARHRPAPALPARAPNPRSERAWVAALLVIHAVLALWAAARNSVTFDENFHVPAGVVEVTRGTFLTSAVNPPLVKALFGAAVMTAGARPPADSAIAQVEQSIVGESFMRRNADRYHRVFFAARLVTVVLSLMLGLLVWRFARRLYGIRGGLLALGFYAFVPEAIAHAGLATLDIATALGILASVYAGWRFARHGLVRHWFALALAVSFTFLTRFSALALLALLPLLTAVLVRRGRGMARRVTIGLAMLLPTIVAALALGYLGRVSFRPIERMDLASRPFQGLQRAWPGLRLPLPDEYIAGLDWQSFEAAGQAPTYLFGRITYGPVWYYFPLAILCKWPIGLLAAVVARTVGALRVVRSRARRARELLVVGPIALLLAAAMFLLSLNVGVRYVLPILPFACVWCGGLGAGARRSRGRLWPARILAPASVALVTLVAIESASASPWQLSFFNRFAGGPGGGYRILSDSNVDWGQGLIALREEMKRLRIPTIHLAYHGTTDPSMYGIEYTPYLGGNPGPESDWLAISSFFFVGMTQRMMTSQGRTPPVTLDFRPLWSRRPDATIAGCMYLFKVR